jgi:predicted flap endonuclease-1-like 5' DNA nuclease
VFLTLALVALVIALGLGYVIGRGRRERSPARVVVDVAPPPSNMASPVLPAAPAPTPAPEPVRADYTVAERARVIRSLEAEASAVRRAVTGRDASLAQLNEFAAERRRLFSDLADARGDTARYRQIIIDLENDAPPPLLGGPGTPDDLKLIVGVGPVLERMLYQLGVTTYRQIARWTERDIDEYDARLHEFPGRIRRDGWVTQARALHRSKYGAEPLARDRA